MDLGNISDTMHLKFQVISPSLLFFPKGLLISTSVRKTVVAAALELQNTKLHSKIPNMKILGPSNFGSVVLKNGQLLATCM